MINFLIEPGYDVKSLKENMEMVELISLFLIIQRLL